MTAGSSFDCLTTATVTNSSSSRRSWLKNRNKPSTTSEDIWTVKAPTLNQLFVVDVRALEEDPAELSSELILEPDNARIVELLLKNVGKSLEADNKEGELKEEEKEDDIRARKLLRSVSNAALQWYAALDGVVMKALSCAETDGVKNNGDVVPFDPVVCGALADVVTKGYDTVDKAAEKAASI